jgi:hypothetical protein
MCLGQEAKRVCKASHTSMLKRIITGIKCRAQSAFDLTNAIALVAIAPVGAEKLVDLDDCISSKIVDYHHLRSSTAFLWRFSIFCAEAAAVSKITGLSSIVCFLEMKSRSARLTSSANSS